MPPRLTTPEGPCPVSPITHSRVLKRIRDGVAVLGNIKDIQNLRLPELHNANLIRVAPPAPEQR
jgi:hypothetical protein